MPCGLSGASTWLSSPCTGRWHGAIVWLLIAENEPMHAAGGSVVYFGNLPPYLRKKDVLCYRMLIHIRSTADFHPRDPSPPSSPPDSDDGDSGHDGNPDCLHFSRGSELRIQGFRCESNHATTTMHVDGS